MLLPPTARRRTITRSGRYPAGILTRVGAFGALWSCMRRLIQEPCHKSHLSECHSRLIRCRQLPREQTVYSCPLSVDCLAYCIRLELGREHGLDHRKDSNLIQFNDFLHIQHVVSSLHPGPLLHTLLRLCMFREIDYQVDIKVMHGIQ